MFFAYVHVLLCYSLELVAGFFLCVCVCVCVCVFFVSGMPSVTAPEAKFVTIQ